MILIRRSPFILFLLLGSYCSHQSESGTSAASSGVTLSPAGGPVAGGNTLTVTGANLPPAGVVAVQVGGNACTISSFGANSVSCTVPPGALGWVNVTVNLKGQNPAVVAQKYAYGATVVGHADMNSNALGFTNSLTQPQSVVVAASNLFVADEGAGRIAVFTPSPSVSAVAPSFVLGQTDLAGGQVSYAAGNGTALTTGRPRSMCSDGTRFLVADPARHRVLVYNTTPTAFSTLPNFVLGQKNISGDQANQGGTTLDATMLNSPQGVFCNSTYIIVADTGNNRVLIWNSAIATNGQAANFVLGQADFNGGLANQNVSVGPATLSGPRAVLLIGSNLFVSDSGNQRVLVWTAFPPTGNDAPAIIALGTASLTSATGAGCTSAGLSNPDGIAQSGNYLYVTDTDYHRILFWDVTSAGGIATPWPSGTPAGFVLGQNDFVSCSANQGLATASLSTLRSPTGVFSNGTSLFVTDSGNNRILIYPAAPSTSATAAALFLGQNLSTGVNPDYSFLNATTLKSPQSAQIIGNSLYVADATLNRVVVYTPVPTSPGTSGSYVLGQPDLFTAVANSVNGGVSAQTLAAPKGVYADAAQNIYVADSGNNRVLVFASPVTSAAPSASPVVGQAAATTSTAGSTAAALHDATAVCSADGQLFVADSGNHRILVYNAWSTAGGSGQSATYALGQPDLTSHAANQGGVAPSAQTLWTPTALACNASSLFVADTGNNRVLVYSLPVAASGPAAVLVLGQNDFVSRKGNWGNAIPNMSNLFAPRGVAVDTNKLYVSDTHNNRLLIWNSLPTTNGQSADALYGQPDKTQYFPNAGSSTPTLTTVSDPAGLSVSGGQLVISDRGNSRVVIVPEP